MIHDLTKVPPKKRRQTRSWKTEAKNWEQSYLDSVRLEVKVALGTLVVGLVVGWLLRAWAVQ